MVGNSSKSCTNRERPSFFKIIISGYPTDNLLRIPPKFLGHIHNDMSERATLKLKASSDCSWNVRVKRTTSGVYLQDGWQEFLHDNGLGNSELLVFKYGGKMCFTIQIFDKKGFERTDDFPNSSTHENLNSANRKRPRKIKLENAGSSSEVYEIKEEQEEDNQDNAARDLATFKSKFPHFIKKRCKKGTMALPVSFSRKYLSPGKSEMYMLENSKGRRTWEVRVYPPPSGNQHFFTAGWNYFVKDNQIEAGDTCVFELVGRSKMVVHIFPGVRKM